MTHILHSTTLTEVILIWEAGKMAAFPLIRKCSNKSLGFFKSFKNSPSIFIHLSRVCSWVQQPQHSHPVTSSSGTQSWPWPPETRSRQGVLDPQDLFLVGQNSSPERHQGARASSAGSSLCGGADPPVWPWGWPGYSPSGCPATHSELLTPEGALAQPLNGENSFWMHLILFKKMPLKKSQVF